MPSAPWLTANVGEQSAASIPVDEVRRNRTRAGQEEVLVRARAGKNTVEQDCEQVFAHRLPLCRQPLGGIPSFEA